MHIYNDPELELSSAVTRIFRFGGTVEIHATLCLGASSATCTAGAASGTTRSCKYVLNGNLLGYDRDEFQ